MTRSTTRRDPTLETLGLMAAVFLLQQVAPLVGIGPAWVALSLPIETRPWALATSVYAHGSLTHLLANAVAVALAGPVVARRTTRLRFHAFFLGTGALAGLATVGFGAALGRSAAVLGASGAVLALVGYLLAGNPVSDRAIGRVSLSPRSWLLLVTALVVLVAVVTGGPGVAVTGHVAGFLLGLAAGRRHILRPR